MKLEQFAIGSKQNAAMWLALLTMCCALCAARAEDNPADYVTQTIEYTYFGGDNGFEISGVLDSDDFGFTPSPGDVSFTVVSAYYDDYVGISSNVSIVGNRLLVNFYAVDYPDGDPYDWDGYDIVIQWKAKRQCSSCSSCTPSTPTCGNNCVNVNIGLGKDGYDNNAGRLYIYSDFPSSTLPQPAGLQIYPGPTTQIIHDGSGALRQVLTSQVLADIVTSNQYCYVINFYSAGNFSSSPVNGLYAQTGLPFNTLTVQNPDGSTDDNRLRVNESGSLGNHQYDYVWSASAQQWTLTTGGGLRTETRTKNWDPTGTFLTETNVVLNSDGSVAFKQIETYELFSWGPTNLIQRIINPDGALPQVYTWTYYTNSADTTNYSQLEQITEPSGYWERYSYDTSGRILKTVAQFGNAPTNAPDSQCRVTLRGFLATDNFVITTNIQTLLGQEISRSYRVDFLGGSSNIVCQTPGAAINAPDNLVTVSLQYTSGPFQGMDYLTQNPDGTIKVYQYSTNFTSMTTAVYSGVPDATGTNVVDGMETVSTVGLGGNAISNATYDIASGQLLTSAVTLQTDQLSRPTLVQYNDGTTEATQYGCCGIESQTDREGTTTTYNYDDLQRVSSMTRNGITTFYTYDAMGRVLTTTRQGTDDSEILQNVSTYNPAGWLTASTNALNFDTLYSQTLDADGDTIKTTTNADGSTRIDAYLQDNSALFTLGTAMLGVSNIYGVEIPVGESVYRPFTQEIKLDTNGVPTGEWTKTYTDMVGRAYKTVYADGSFSQSFYNNQGQLYEQVDPDGVTTLYQYDAKGEVQYMATDMNTNGVIDFGGTDRITMTTNDVTIDNGTTVNRSRTYVWNVDNSTTSNLISQTETSADGLKTWNIVFNNGVGVTNYSATVYDPSRGYRFVTAVAPDGSSTYSVYQYGLLLSTTLKDANGVVLGRTTYGYDTHGRQNTVTDLRNGTTTSFFDNADQAIATLTPSPDGIQLGQLTTNVLNNMGRVIQTILPDNTSVTNVYFPNGLLEESYGSRTYPVAYTYDYAGRMKTMTTWTNFAASTGAAVTTWNYDGLRGFLTNKAYADGLGPSYTYTTAGRLKTRVWARGVGRTNFYDNAGELWEVNYSDATIGFTNGYDRLGRLITVTNGTTVCQWTYNGANELLSETFSSGPLDGLSVTNGYDSLLRRTKLSALSASSQLVSANYGYDAASRLSTVSDGTNNAVYSYLANSPLVSQITFSSNNVVRMTTTKQYDYLNRLTGIQSCTGSASVASFNYGNNAANQRVAVTNADNSYWIYQYDNLGQVTSGKKYWADGTPVAGQQFTYNFDNIGNRRSTASGGDQSGAGLRPANYTNSILNQITGRDVPGYMNVIGSANANATVTVNLQRAYRYGGYFADELAVNNTGTALWLSLTNLAVLNNGTNADVIATNTGNVFLAQTPQTFQYDADGNLTNDGVFSYGWDAENRLTSVVSLSTVPTNAAVQETWNYLPDGRWSQVIVSKWNGTTYAAQSTNQFLWDGQMLLAEVTPNGLLIRGYMRGTDLSSTMQGAGEVGGLLEVSYYGTAVTNCFVAYDGNRNVSALVNALDGTTVANYEYDPFGQTIRMTGAMAKANPMRFSTQWADDNIGDVRYLYRNYNPSIGRWESRDLVEEGKTGGLYCAFVNSPAVYYDGNGNTPSSSSPEQFPQGPNVDPLTWGGYHRATLSTEPGELGVTFMEPSVGFPSPPYIGDPHGDDKALQAGTLTINFQYGANIFSKEGRVSQDTLHHELKHAVDDVAVVKVMLPLVNKVRSWNVCCDECNLIRNKYLTHAYSLTLNAELYLGASWDAQDYADEGLAKVRAGWAQDDKSAYNSDLNTLNELKTALNNCLTKNKMIEPNWPPLYNLPQ
jgi:RHS repeat-associated protein